MASSSASAVATVVAATVTAATAVAAAAEAAAAGEAAAGRTLSLSGRGSSEAPVTAKVARVDASWCLVFSAVPT